METFFLKIFFPYFSTMPRIIKPKAHKSLSIILAAWLFGVLAIASLCLGIYWIVFFEKYAKFMAYFTLPVSMLCFVLSYGLQGQKKWLPWFFLFIFLLICGLTFASFLNGSISPSSTFGLEFSLFLVFLFLLTLLFFVKNRDFEN